MLDSLRMLVLSVLYYFGFTYAAFTALGQRVTFDEEEEEVEVTGQPPQRRTKVLIGTPALKLMIMLTSTALLSFVGAEWFPLFAEMRVIFMYTLLFSPPFTQQEIYDQVFAPLLVRGGTLALSLQTSNFLSRKVPLFIVRHCVDCGIAAMNYAQRHHALDEDAVRDILSGLAFSKRALREVADLSRETDGAAYAAIARDSNFAVGVFTSRVKRALLNEPEPEEEEAPVPRGRVARERDTWGSTVSSLTATAVESLDSSGWSNGQVESIHSEQDFQVGERDGRRGGGSRRDKRKKHKFFGLF